MHLTWNIFCKIILSFSSVHNEKQAAPHYSRQRWFFKFLKSSIAFDSKCLKFFISLLAILSNTLYILNSMSSLELPLGFPWLQHVHPKRPQIHKLHDNCLLLCNILSTVCSCPRASHHTFTHTYNVSMQTLFDWVSIKLLEMKVKYILGGGWGERLLSIDLGTSIFRSQRSFWIDMIVR